MGSRDDLSCIGCGGVVARSRAPAGGALCGTCAALTIATATTAPGGPDGTGVSAEGPGTIRMKAISPPGARKSRARSAGNWPAGFLLTLEAIEGPAKGTVFHLRERSVLIGREEGLVRIQDPMISRRHALIEIIDTETIVLKDLSSTNGTYHNNDLIAFSKLADGDEIRIGATVLAVTLEAAERALGGQS